MPSKLERLRSRMKSMRESTERIGKNILHTGETLILGAGGAYLEGRMSKTGGEDDGEWGYKGVPYLYMGGAVAFLTGLFAGDKYSHDLFSSGAGLVGGHLFRTMYESGLEAKNKAPATKGAPRQMASPQYAPAATQTQTRVPMGSAIDGL
jgi:hypothetical protein